MRWDLGGRPWNRNLPLMRCRSGASAPRRSRRFVGVDLHRRRTVLVRTTDAGEVLESVRISNDVESLDRVMARAGVDPEVVLEATYGWYWAVDALQETGAHVHLAHPLGVKAFEYRRGENKQRAPQRQA